MHFYKFKIGDYASHTRHLTPLEDIAYRRMLDLAYSSEQPLTKDLRQLSRLINMRDYQQEIQDVLAEFWVEVDEGWINNRVLKEIESTGGKSEKARQSAQARWDAIKKANLMREECERMQNECERMDDAMRTHEKNEKNDATQDPRLQTIDLRPKTTPIEVISFTDGNTMCRSSHSVSTDEKTPKKTPKKATALPENWVLPKTWGDWALEEFPSLNAEDVRLMASMFKDHWLANATKANSKKADWFATWRNWVRRSDPNKANVPKTGKTYHESCMDTADQIFGRKKHGTEHTIIDITPRQATGSGTEDFPAAGICFREEVA